MLARMAKIALLSVLLAWAATTMTAEPSRFLRPVAGERLESAGSIEVSWALDRSQAASFDEMELVLSLDGGRSFPLRLTRDLSPGSGHLIWRIPALPTGSARLALRGGSDETPDSETIAAVSDVFEIAPRGGLDLEQLFPARGEWRTRESATSPSAPTHHGFSADPTDQMRSAATREIAAERPAPAAPIGASDRELPNLRSGSSTDKLGRTVLRSSPLPIPLRQ